MKIFIDGSSQNGPEFRLVQFRPQLESIKKRKQKMVYITISPNANVRTPVKRSYNNRSTIIKVKYRDLSHVEQYNYLQLVMKNSYLKYIEPEDWIYGIYEINEDNNLHIHMLLYSPQIQDEYSLQALRKTIYAEVLTQRNMDKRPKKPQDWMNEIVWLEWERLDYVIDYFMKQTEIKNEFSDFKINIF